MKKNFGFAFLIISLAILLTACIPGSAGDTSPEPDAKKELKISGYTPNSFLLENAIEVYEAEHTDYSIVYDEYDMMNVGNLQLELMSGSKEFDIFTNLNAVTDFLGLYEAGMYVDLYEYDQIKEKLENDRLIEETLAPCIVDGKLLGIPCMFKPDMMRVNDAVLAELDGIELPDADWTWEDFYELAKAARQDINGDGKPDVYCTSTYNKSMPWFLYDCAREYYATDGAWNFESQEFQELMRIWKRLYDEDLVIDDMERSGEPLLFEFRQSFCYENIEYSYEPQYEDVDLDSVSEFMHRNTTLLPIPYVRAGVPHATDSNTRLVILSVYAGSENIDAAVDLLATLLDEQVLQETLPMQILLYEGGAEHQALYDEMNAQNEGEVVSVLDDATLELYRFVSGNTVQNVLPERLDREFQDMIGRYVAGSLPLEELCSTMNQRMETFLNE